MADKRLLGAESGCVGVKYIIMLTIVIGLAISDFLTGIIKAYVTNDLSSSKMRKGGLNKLAEIIVMATSCGVEIGLGMLGAYYQAEQLAAISGAVASGVVLGYIVIMELISILENYAEINPEAAWAGKIIKRLRNIKSKEENDHGDKNV